MIDSLALKNIEKQQERLYEFLEDGTYSKSVFVERNIALSQKREQTLSAIEKAKKSAMLPIDYKEKIVQLTDAVTALTDKNVPIALKNELLKNVISEIKYSCHTSNRTKWDHTQFSIDVLLKF